MTLSPFLSQKFRFWAFVSMFLLVFVHGYNLELRYLQPWTVPDEPLTFTSFTEYLFANGLFRFRIPILFIISGYLYALHDAEPNKQRIGKRVRSLLLPYLIWSAFGIALSYVFELFSYTNHLVVSSHVMQIDNTRVTIHEYHWYEILARWIFFPVSYQLWFIRVLLIYNLAYPLIKWCILNKAARIVLFSLATLMWLATAGFILIEGEGLLFFSLGVWIQKTDFNITSSSRWTKPLPWAIIFLLCAFVKTYLAFTGLQLMGGAAFQVITLLHKLTVLSGLISCWYGLDGIVKWCMNRQWFVWLSAFSFMIYVMHAPLVAILINGMFEWLNYMPGYRMMTFIALPLMVIALCILVGMMLRKISPKLYGLLTGGRGL